MGDERLDPGTFQPFQVDPDQIDDFIQAAESELRSLASEEAPLAVRDQLRERAYIVNPEGQGIAIEGENSKVQIGSALQSAFGSDVKAVKFMDGATLTHLHPLFIPQSGADLQAMVFNRLKSVRVVGGPLYLGNAFY